MTPAEVQQLLRLVCGYWPNPVMTDDEIRVWTRTLAQCSDAQLAAKTVDGLALSGRDFRPTAGRFAGEYHASQRAPSDFPELPASSLTPEDVARLIADCRARLTKEPI